MPTAVTRRPMSPEEYVAWEIDQLERHEYHDGEVFAMAGGSLRHALLVANASRLLGAVLEGPCLIFSPDLRVRLDASHYVYPDVTALCGPAEVDHDGLSLLNPTLIVEVLSPSTEAWDRGGKRRLYARVASLQEVVLIPQDSRAVEVYRRNEAGRWEVFEPEGDRLLLRTGGAALDLDALYAGLDALPDPPEGAPDAAPR